LLQRRLRDDAIEQRRQRHVEDEEVHPGEARLRDCLELPAAKPQEDQAEERQRQIDDLEHAGCLSAAPALVNLPDRCPQKQLGEGRLFLLP
jgi:hypothetical protein